jgi:Spy/CpxP family protein refolding chaperone
MVRLDRGKEVREMKVILRSLLVASLFFLLFNYLSAKTGEELTSREKMKIIEQRREEYRQESLERLSRELALTKEQEEKISQTMEEGWEKISEEMRKMRERTLAIRKETDSQIEKLLTPEQVEKFRKLKEELREKREKSIKERGINRGGGRKHFEPEYGE